MIIRVFGIPLLSQPIDIQRGDKVEYQKLLVRTLCFIMVQA